MHTIMSEHKSVEVFKTNVNESVHARQLVALLQQHFPGSRINFDLDDCDKVLRVEGHNLRVAKVMDLVQENGFHCRILE